MESEDKPLNLKLYTLHEALNLHKGIRVNAYINTGRCECGTRVYLLTNKEVMYVAAGVDSSKVEEHYPYSDILKSKGLVI